MQDRCRSVDLEVCHELINDDTEANLDSLVAPRTSIRESLPVIRPSQRDMNSAFLQVVDINEGFLQRKGLVPTSCR